jgi:hypothetical protein
VASGGIYSLNQNLGESKTYTLTFTAVDSAQLGYALVVSSTVALNLGGLASKTFDLAPQVSDTAGNTLAVSNVKAVIADVAPVAPAGSAFANLADMTVSDYSGFWLIQIASGGVIDPLGRTIQYSATGLPVGLTIDGSTGILNGLYDANIGGGGIEIFNITMKAQIATNALFITKSFVLSIRDDG